MQVKIRGEITQETIMEAFSKTCELLGLNQDENNNLTIRGASIYFNLYDKETGQMVQMCKDGVPIEKLEYGGKPVKKEVKNKKK